MNMRAETNHLLASSGLCCSYLWKLQYHIKVRKTCFEMYIFSFMLLSVAFACDGPLMESPRRGIGIILCFWFGFFWMLVGAWVTQSEPGYKLVKVWILPQGSCLWLVRLRDGHRFLPPFPKVSKIKQCKEAFSLWLCPSAVWCSIGFRRWLLKAFFFSSFFCE